MKDLKTNAVTQMKEILLLLFDTAAEKEAAAVSALLSLIFLYEYDGFV